MSETKANEPVETPEDEKATGRALSNDGAAEGDTEDQSPPSQGVSSDLPATG